MGILFTYDTSHLTTVRDRTPRLQESAESGAVGQGEVVIEDAAGSLTITGHKDFRVTESSCATVTTFRGYVGARRYKRGEAAERTGTSRWISLDTVDLNARLGFKILRGISAKRPAETISARLAWLLATTTLNTLVFDNGFVSYPTTMMDEADLRGMRPGDVLSDMAQRVGYNFFVYWDESANQASLWFADANVSTNFTSTLRISSLSTDVDTSTTFAAGGDTELSRDPSRVVSGVWLPFKKGNVYRTRTATETTYAARDGTAPNANVVRRAKARLIADQFLYTHRNEEDRITTTIQLPAAKVNLVRAGMRIQAKFTEFTQEGYGSAFTYFRVLTRTVSPLVADAGEYAVELVLSPQETTCGTIIQSSGIIASPATATLANPVTPGSVLVAVGFRTNTSGVPPVHYLGVDAGFTDLGQPLESTGNDGGSEGRVWMQAKLTDSSTPAGAYGFDDGGRYLWKLYELGAAFANRTVLSQAEGASNGQSATLDIGDFASSSGVAIMVQAVGKSTGHAAFTGTTDFIAMGAWTERYDGRVDPADSGSLPFIGIGDIIPGGATVDAAWAWSGHNPGEDIGTWAGIACLFGC